MGALEKSQANANSMQRVKVYRLNDDGKWDDQGTGHVTVDYLERSEELGLFVYDEEDNETILLHRITSDDIYRKQEDTIISWRDPEYATELALSFQEPSGCSYIWDHICNVQRNMHFNTLNSEAFHSVNSELRELPAVELSTLPLILKTLVESGIADQLRLTELILNDQEFFRKLVEVFRVCEDLENMDGLHMIFKIVKGIIMLNSTQIFERIFSDEFIMDVIGALEYDPEIPHVQHHRKFLKEHVIFKEAIPIKDTLVLSKIHQTYRVGFFKDVVLARVLDEATVANLNSIIHANNAIVVSLLKDDSTFIQELFARLKSPTTSSESKKNMVYFLHEFCSLSKSLQMVQQLRLFRDLMYEGIFDIVTDVLQSQDKKLVLTGTDILILFLNQDANLLRSYVVRQEGITLLGLLVRGMITDFGDDMHCQFLEILRSLLDSCTLSGSQRDTIIDIFYEKHLGQLIEVITASCPSENVARASSKSIGPGLGVQYQSGTKPEILSNICELLCFCVLHHPYRIKCNFLLNNMIDKILLLTRRREKYLVVGAARRILLLLLLPMAALTSTCSIMRLSGQQQQQQQQQQQPHGHQLKFAVFNFITRKQNRISTTIPLASASNQNRSPGLYSAHKFDLTASNVDLVLEDVRPYLIADGGNVDVVSVEDGVISLRLQGACESCPSSTTTMKMGIERVLKEKFGDAVKDILQVYDHEPEETTVEAVNNHLEILRPAIKNYGGSVEVLSVEGGDCHVKYVGPDSIGSGIKAAIKEKFPHILNVTFST